jgi:hypothetical protein
MTPQEFGLDWEKRVADKLIAGGSGVNRMRNNSPFDLLVNGRYRVEVKAARPSKNWRWVINFHRHGSLKEVQVDAYVVVLDGIPGNGKMPVYMVIPAPFGKAILDLSFSSILRKYRKYIDNWSIIGHQAGPDAEESAA